MDLAALDALIDKLFDQQEGFAKGEVRGDVLAKEYGEQVIIDALWRNTIRLVSSKGLLTDEQAERAKRRIESSVLRICVTCGKPGVETEFRGGALVVHFHLACHPCWVCGKPGVTKRLVTRDERRETTFWFHEECDKGGWTQEEYDATHDEQGRNKDPEIRRLLGETARRLRDAMLEAFPPDEKPS